MDIKKPLVYLLLIPFVLSVHGCKRGATRDIASQQGQKPRGDWKTYKDKYLSFEHPSDWVVLPLDENVEARSALWGIAPPESKTIGSYYGAIDIIGRCDGKEHRPLMEIYRDKIKGPEKVKVLAKPVKLKLGKGRCIAYKLDWTKNPKCGKDALGRAKLCMEPTLYADCYDSSGNYYDFMSQLGKHEIGKPDDYAKRNTRVAEGVLKSLRFN